MSFSDPNPYASPSTTAEVSIPALLSQDRSDFPLASRWKRLAGSFIDGLLLVAATFFVGILYGMAMAITGMEVQFEREPVAAALLSFVVGGGTFLAIHGYLLATRSQTVGKYLLKMQIVAEDCRVVPFWRMIALRYLPMWLIAVVPGIGGFVVLADALAIFRESRKCFHDDIAGTKVIQL